MGCADSLPRTIWWGTDEADGKAGVFMVDQTRLPLRGDVLCCRTHGAMITAIKTLAVRGAPAIGVSGALALAVWSENESDDTTVESYLASIEQVGELVASARPTAVNLSWGVNRVLAFVRQRAAEGASLVQLKADLVDLGIRMCEEDEQTNRAIGEHGADVLSPGSRIMTHCNAGSLATVFYGTALGVVFTAYDRGLVEHVYPCETRPVNQGGRITAWELMMAGIPSTLACDNMSATLMSKGMVNTVIVGADRIAANGDTANKIGTMGHAVLAKHFGIPFYIAAPFSTIDLSIASGAEIVIEQRDPREVQGVTGSGIIAPESDDIRRALNLLTVNGPADLGTDKAHQLSIYRKDDAFAFDAWIRNTPVGVDVFNPAFDVTPCSLITGIITEKGVFRPQEDGRFHFE